MTAAARTEARRRRRLEQLAGELRCELRYLADDEGPPNASGFRRRATVPAPTSTRAFLVGLHELGHVGSFDLERDFVYPSSPRARERRAWKWAKEHAGGDWHESHDAWMAASIEHYPDLAGDDEHRAYCRRRIAEGTR